MYPHGFVWIATVLERRSTSQTIVYCLVSGHKWIWWAYKLCLEVAFESILVGQSCRHLHVDHHARIHCSHQVLCDILVNRVTILATGAKVSLKSIHSFWLNPLATSLALYLSTVPSALNLILKTHLELMGDFPWVRIMKVHVLLSSSALISLFIASIHLGSLDAWR